MPLCQMLVRGKNLISLQSVPASPLHSAHLLLLLLLLSISYLPRCLRPGGTAVPPPAHTGGPAATAAAAAAAARR